MLGKKVNKRKRLCTTASVRRWSLESPGKKDTACQVDFDVIENVDLKLTKSTNLVTVRMQTAMSTQTDCTPTTAEDEPIVISAEKIKELCSKFTCEPLSEPIKKHPPEESNCVDNEKETLSRKVESFFNRKSHKVQELTSNNFDIKPSCFVISDSDVLRDAVLLGKCSGCGKSETLEFVKEKEPQTGVLNLKYICYDCKKPFSISSSNDIIRT